MFINMELHRRKDGPPLHLGSGFILQISWILFPKMNIREYSFRMAFERGHGCDPRGRPNTHSWLTIETYDDGHESNARKKERKKKQMWKIVTYVY